MIPYDELVAALASWRQRQGLPAGPADYLGEPSQARYDDYPPAVSAPAGGGYGGGYSEDVVELSDEMMDSVVEEQSSPYSVVAEEMEYAVHGESDTQDQDLESATSVEQPPEPEAEPEPEPAPTGGRRKRKR